MANKVWFLIKRFATFLTFTGLLFSMNPLVVNKVWFLVKNFATFFTLIGLLSSMNYLVVNKSWFCNKIFATFITCIWLLLLCDFSEFSVASVRALSKYTSWSVLCEHTALPHQVTPTCNCCVWWAAEHTHLPHSSHVCLVTTFSKSLSAGLDPLHFSASTRIPSSIFHAVPLKHSEHFRTHHFCFIVLMAGPSCSHVQRPSSWSWLVFYLEEDTWKRFMQKQG